jgi:hypothetical protein
MAAQKNFHDATVTGQQMPSIGRALLDQADSLWRGTGQDFQTAPEAALAWFPQVLTLAGIV